MKQVGRFGKCDEAGQVLKDVIPWNQVGSIIGGLDKLTIIGGLDKLTVKRWPIFSHFL